MTVNSFDPKMLRTAVWSLTQQTLQDFELILVARDVESIYIIEEMRTDYEFRWEGIWEYSARTRSERFKIAVDACRGQWIAVLDSDDILHPDALWTTYRCLKKFPLMNFFSGSHKVFDLQTNQRGDNPATPLAQSIKSLSHAFKQRHFWGFRNDPSRWPVRLFETQYLVEDYWFFSVLAMNSVPVLHIPHYLYAWRSHPGQWTRSKRTECVAMCANIQDYLRKFSKKQSPMWHWGDMALATRLTACMVRLQEEVLIGEDS